MQSSGLLRARDKDGDTPLHSAVRYIYHETERVHSFPGPGVPLAERVALGSDKVMMMSILLYHGADINALNAIGITVIQSAISMGMTETVKCLLESDARFTKVVDHEGNTPLHIAVLKDIDRSASISTGAYVEQHRQRVRQLLERGAGIGSRDSIAPRPLGFIMTWADGLLISWPYQLPGYSP